MPRDEARTVGEAAGEGGSGAQAFQVRDVEFEIITRNPNGGVGA